MNTFIELPYYSILNSMNIDSSFINLFKYHTLLRKALIGVIDIPVKHGDKKGKSKLPKARYK